MRVVVAIVLGLAVVGVLAWRHYHSRDAQIERAYAACMARFAGAKAAPPAATSGAAPSAADALGEAMTDLVRGVTSGMSGAVCGALRDACRADFDGVVCRNAIAGFR